MENLAQQIKSEFPIERIEVSYANTIFVIYFEQNVTDIPAHLKAINAIIKDFIAEHGDPKAEYEFTFYRDRELLDILYFNNEDPAHYITMDLFGKTQQLRVQDVLGMEGQYTVFNEDFERIGSIAVVVPTNHLPLAEPDAPQGQDDDDRHLYSDNIYPDFSNPTIWTAEPAELKPYLNEILEKVLEDINSKTEVMEINMDDPEEISFWADQFELSENDLKKTVLAAGKSIDDITAYLQK
ncbi:DUF3606 domain-containing protein [Pedobacter sp. PWIIR3]